ncbi:hypothetical protein HGG76_10515 [Ochrobactrum tritici]|uniref:Uncharacterized protein n=1 Tax=Brucella tritici TaxID=94626 RepID=A0A7X6FQ03_9HYPH|nr:hypothetical protein [Brucella tritici]
MSNYCPVTRAAFSKAFSSIQNAISRRWMREVSALFRKSIDFIVHHLEN